MSYCQTGGIPWMSSESWFAALCGGTQVVVRAPGVTTSRLPIDVFTLMKSGFNPSVAVSGGRLHVVVRGFAGAPNVLAEIEGRQIVNARPMRDVSGSGPWAYGYEDVRLFDLGGRLGASATVARAGVTVGVPRAQMAVLDLDGADIIAVHVIPSDRYERNWMPVVRDGRLSFIYSSDPLVVLPYDGAQVPGGVPEIRGTLRGGSQLIAWRGEWLAIVHEVAGARRDDAVYSHRFAIFDAALQSVRVSAPFHLSRVGIEFVAGLAQVEDGRLMLSYGIDDREAVVGYVTPETVDAMFNAAVSITAPAAPPAPSPQPPRPAPRAPLIRPARTAPPVRPLTRRSAVSHSVASGSQWTVSGGWNPLLGFFGPGGAPR